MNIEALARECDMYVGASGEIDGYIADLEKFAAIIREAVVQELVGAGVEPWVLRDGETVATGLYTADQLAGAVARERERIASYVQSQDDMVPPEVIAAAIRSGKCD